MAENKTQAVEKKLAVPVPDIVQSWVGFCLCNWLCFSTFSVHWIIPFWHSSLYPKRSVSALLPAHPNQQMGIFKVSDLNFCEYEWMHNGTLEDARIFRNNCSRAWFVGQYMKIYSQTINVDSCKHDLLSSALQFSFCCSVFESVRNIFLSRSVKAIENNHILSYQRQHIFAFSEIYFFGGREIQNFYFIYSFNSPAFVFPTFLVPPSVPSYCIILAAL